MFRITGTFLVIFLILNHDFAAAHNIENMPHGQVIQKRQAPDREVEATGLEDETEIALSHSRQKRRWGALVRGGLAVLAGGSFALSVGTTVYQAIRKCKDFRPKPCGTPKCEYLKGQCPDVCVGPDTNRGYIMKQKDVMRKRLDLLDRIQTNAFNLATKAVSAGLNNKRILTEINRINDKVDQLMFDLVDLDIEVATKFRNKSVELKTLIRNEKLKLNDITGSPEMQGIFDKWTWEGTGTFVLSLALPIGLKLFSYIRERYAIHKLYKEMKADFSQRFINQKAAVNPNGANQPKLKNKFAYVQGYSTKKIDAQLKQSAKAVHNANKANKKVTRTEKFTNKVLGPAVNVVVTLLSAWQVYQFFASCQKVANDMQQDAIKMANQKNKIEKMKVTQVDPLYRDVRTKAWGAVRKFLTKGTTSDWLLSIRRLTLGASKPNTTTANSIQHFLNNIVSAGVDKTIELQKKLIPALESVDFEFGCLSDKQHAVTLVIKDCRTGRAPLKALYKDAENKYKLNRRRCIDSKMVPYTTLKQFKKIVASYSQRQGWYSNCLLNDNNLLIRVCDTRLKGYVTPKEIVKQINKRELTEEMVCNFLNRCPPPKITPKARKDTCLLYCLYENVTTIAKAVVLLERQVKQIIAKCSLCRVRNDQKKVICYQHYCKRETAGVIEPQVRLPLPTVKHVINNVCVRKCIPSKQDKQKICLNYKCKSLTARKIARKVGLPLATVNQVIPKCNTILPKCPQVTPEVKNNVLKMHCVYRMPATTISGIVSLPLSTVKKILAETPCSKYTPP